MPNRKQGDWWDRSLTLVSGCNWPPNERPPECDACYAIPMVERFAAIHGGHPFGEVRTHFNRFDWLKPTGKALTWLCSIAGDLFHPDVPSSEFIVKVLIHIRATNRTRLIAGRELHRIAILTKRYDRAVSSFALGINKAPFPGLILMPSAGTQDSVNRACMAMARLPKEIRWGIHIEPLLEKISWRQAICAAQKEHESIELPVWIVCGGETNVRNRRVARPCHPDWVREIRDECAAVGVPFWFKSHGEWAPYQVGADGLWRWSGDGSLAGEWENTWIWSSRYESVCVGKKCAGRILDGHTHDEMPEGWENHER